MVRPGGISIEGRSGTAVVEVRPPHDATTSSGRTAVLDAAAELFVTQGHAATTLRSIASRAGMKAGSIYHHFASKDELFLAVLERGIDVMVDAFGQAATLATEIGANDVRLLAHVRGHLGALFEHGPYTAAHVTAFFTAPDEVRDRIVPVRDGYERLWIDLLADLLPAAGEPERSLLRLVLFGAMNSTIEWFDPGGATSLDDLAALITDQFLNGVVQ